MWQTVREGLRGDNTHLVRVENGVDPGTPDVEYCIAGHTGWLELKVADPLPVRATTPVNLRHWTQVQRSWMVRRALAGGAVFMLLRLGRNVYTLHDARTAVANTTGWSAQDWQANAVAVWQPRVDWPALLLHLCAGPKKSLKNMLHPAASRGTVGHT